MSRASRAACAAAVLAFLTAVFWYLDVVLTIYSVVVFATLAGSLGAFFLETRSQPQPSGVQPTGVQPTGVQPAPGVRP